MIKLWEQTPLFDESIGQQEPSITQFLLGGDNNMCVIVAPGGAYYGKAVDHEGYKIVKWLNKIGFSAFLLDYRVHPYKAPIPLLDMQRAIRLVRANAEKYGVNPNKIGVLGFSAGAHLSASAAVLYDKTFSIKEKYGKVDDIDEQSSRPDFAVLCYPPTDMLNTYLFPDAETPMFGRAATYDEKLLYSIPNQATKDTPPIFMWHTSDDGCVPVLNPLLLAQKLCQLGSKFELHIFPSGSHGLGLAENDPVVGQWPTLCEKWLNNIKKS